MIRPLLIGQAFGPSMGRPGGDFPEGFVSRFALTGLAGRRLARLAGIGGEEYVRAFERTNLIRRYPGKAGNGDAFPMPEAKLCATLMRPRLAGRLVVFLGRRVARAFGYGPVPWMEWERGFARGREFLWAVMPHPSGVNHWWNDPANVRAARGFMRSLVG